VGNATPIRAVDCVESTCAGASARANSTTGLNQTRTVLGWRQNERPEACFAPTAEEPRLYCCRCAHGSNHLSLCLGPITGTRNPCLLATSTSGHQGRSHAVVALRMSSPLIFRFAIGDFRLEIARLGRIRSVEHRHQSNCQQNSCETHINDVFRYGTYSTVGFCR
jgi:hypothetical protein